MFAQTITSQLRATQVVLHQYSYARRRASCGAGDGCAIDNGRFAERRIGHERARTSYAFRTFLDHHVHLAFGTDWDIAPLNPLLDIYAAVTRETIDGKHPQGWFPEQKLSVGEAVRAYTVGLAYAAFKERELGTLTPGKLADYVVLDRDIFQIPPDDIKNVRVIKTVMGGRVVYSIGDYPVAYDK
jgi:predicted amidohydrolase YtcJ